MWHIAIALVLGSSDQNFDLICEGTRTVTGYLLKKETEPYLMHYRIDLEKGLWCEDQCKAHHQIVDVGPAQITLEKREETLLRGELSNFINRETGEHRVLSISPRRETPLMLQWKGTCRPAPFSGFPALETKF